jgi:hypothetical protein
MQTGVDIESLLAQANALVEQAQVDLGAGLSFRREHAAEFRLLAQAARRGEEELRRIVAENVSLANQRPVLPAAPVMVDSSTVFARRVRRRRLIV